MKKRNLQKFMGIFMAVVMLLGLMPTFVFAEENLHASHLGYVTHIEATEGDCNTPGNIEFWYCDYYTCRKYYSDEAMTTEINISDTVITPGEHSDDCVDCGYETVEETFGLFVPSEHPLYDEDDYRNNGLHILAEKLVGFRFLFVGEDSEGNLYAMGNATNEDGSREAVDITEYVNDDDTVTIDSDTVEFFTCEEIPNTYTFSPDNGYMSVFDEKIVVHGQNIKDAKDDIRIPQSIRFEQNWEDLDDYTEEKGYLFAWDLNSGIIVFDSEGSAPSFRATPMWTEENGESIDNRAHSIMLYMERCEHTNMTHTEASELSCTEDGIIEHWYCEDCRMYFSDEYGTEYIYLPDGETNYEDYLYTRTWGHSYDNCICENCGETCPHTDAVYEEVEYVEESCFEPGMNGYWFCEECYQYLDENKENGFWEYMDAAKIPATGHAFNKETGVCDNCGIPNPVYKKVTSLSDVNEEDLYIIVAEVEGDDGKEYFALGGLDESNPYENGSILCKEETGNAIPVVPEDDGSISVLNQNQASGAKPSEFMFDIAPEQFGSGLEEFGLTTLMFKLPNYCVYPFQSYSHDNNGYMGIPRYTYEYGQWDSSDWIIDFYTTEKDENTYNDGIFSDEEGLTHAEQIEDGNIGENITEGNLILYNSSFVSVGGAMFTLRLREYDGQFYFICGEDWALEGSDGWDYVTDTTPTNDTQYAVWLYRYDAPTLDNHTCEFTGLKDNGDGTHTGYCECGEEETNPHTWDKGTETKAPTCYEEGEMTYTCLDKCGATMSEAIKVTDHSWSEWTDGGEDTHSRSCLAEECGETEEEQHKFGDWETEGKESHKKTCTICEGTRVDNHNWDEGKVTSESTCVKEGEKTYNCLDCGETKKEPVAAEAGKHNPGDWENAGDEGHIRYCQNDGCDFSETENHEIISEVIQAENCEDEGQDYLSCKICDYEEYKTRPALNHDWDEWKEVTPATETAEGLEKRICKNDSNHVEERPIPVLQHKHVMTNVPKKAATCTENGNISYYCCEGCKGLFADEKGETKLNDEDIIIPALNHDWDTWKDTGTNAVADVHVRSCKREGCGIAETENHEWSDWNSEGSTEHKKTCSVCEGVRSAEHNMDEGETVKDATVTENGVKKYTCIDCGFEKSETIPKIVCDHSFGKWIADDDNTHTHICENGNGCTAYQRLSHEWNEGEVTKEATETEEGIISYTCLSCSHEKEESIPMLKHRHRFGAWESNGEEGHIRYCENGENCTATETEEHSARIWADNEDGTHSGKCMVCGEGMVESHTFGEWKVISGGNLKRICTAECGAYEEMPVIAPISYSVVNSTKSEDNGANAALITDNALDLFNDVLSAEEQASVAEGSTTVSVYLEVSDIPAEEVSASDKEVVEATIESADNALDETTEIGMYLDIELFKEVTKDNESEETKITETNGTVTITIEIPEELLNTDKSKKRTYRIIRIHEDETGNVVTDVIEGKFNSKDNTFTFETDKFSTYAVAYNDKEAKKSGSSGGGAIEYTIIFETNGGSTIAKKYVERNSVLTSPEAPVKEGFEFGGWYTDKEFKTAYDFSAKVTKNLTLYAKWETIKVKFKDVKETDSFYPYISYVVSNNLMVGVSEDEFAPDGNLTRAMIVTILYRAEGEPATNRSIPFSDVDMGAYYAAAVSWAKQVGIVNGVTENEFAPDENVTREQLAAIMLRYAVYKGMDVLTMEENLHFDDASEISEYAVSAMNWAVGNGFINGRSESELMPGEFATRAEIAEFVAKYSLNTRR